LPGYRLHTQATNQQHSGNNVFFHNVNVREPLIPKGGLC